MTWLRALALFGGLMIYMVFTGGVSHAQSGGGVGSGGSGSGGGGAGWGYTYYGWGWRIYPVGSGGPSAGFHTGNWASVSAACNGFSTDVAVFVLDTSAHNQMGYDYKANYYGPPTYAAYQSSPPYISVDDAQAAYNLLPAGIKAGYTWGTNVGWFCYGLIPQQPPDQVPGIWVVTDCQNKRLVGAVWDSDNLGLSAAVDISIGGPAGSAPLVRLVANQNEGNGSFHGFSFALDDNTVRSGQDYWIYAIGIDSSGNYNLSLPYGGNPVHIGPCNSVSCGPETMPDVMAVGRQYYFRVGVNLAAAWANPPYTTSDPKMHYTIRWQATNASPWIVVADTDVLYDAGFPTAGTVITSNPTGVQGDPGISFTPTQSGNYAVTWTFGGTALSTITCVTPGASSISGVAGYQPFFTVTGGDIISGSNIRSWNLDNVNGAGYGGAGTTLAAIATGDIQNFVTGGSLPAGAATRAGSGLAFANNTASGTTYGGGYTTTPFVPTVAGTTVAWGSSSMDLSSPTLVDGTTYTYAGDLTITGQLPIGKNITLVLTSGNAIIGSNITYGAYTTSVEIPRVTVIVSAGNIYVNRAVTEVHGVYSASGNYYSCANGSTPVDMSSASGYSDCRNRLVVYGAVAANQLVLTRTIGSIVPAPGIPVVSAEDFFYSPELWLAESSTGSAGNGVNYNSYVSLPPVL